MGGASVGQIPCNLKAQARTKAGIVKLNDQAVLSGSPLLVCLRIILHHQNHLRGVEGFGPLPIGIITVGAEKIWEGQTCLVTIIMELLNELKRLAKLVDPGIDDSADPPDAHVLNRKRATVFFNLNDRYSDHWLSKFDEHINHLLSSDSLESVIKKAKKYFNVDIADFTF